ncbi:unnamed protein product [Ambrosiozyma monospora]|uniref:Unnamed protein product n=1 Tax=Ambrosiozyma monospora TaxID=43982 RepID=A0ACB5UDB5_AMBMO|nr:unnamed protein product [Ambrosiozyma monospora]
MFGVEEDDDVEDNICAGSAENPTDWFDSLVVDADFNVASMGPGVERLTGAGVGVVGRICVKKESLKLCRVGGDEAVSSELIPG